MDKEPQNLSAEETLSNPENQELVSERSQESHENPEAYKAEIADLKDKLLRCLAETDNVRKRAQREKEETAKFALHRFASELLSVADNLERALKSFEGSASALSSELEALLEGVKITEKEFFNVLHRHQIQKLSPESGEKFDPNIHEAMFEVETDAHPAGTVVQLVQTGYLLHGRLLRPALVGVAKTKKAEEISESALSENS